MDAIEAAQLLTILSAVTDREPTAAQAQGWAYALDDLPVQIGEAALRLALKSPDAGYITPQVIRRHATPLLHRLARDVRSAKLRGLVPGDWPERRPLPDAAQRALAAEWEANNDREALGAAATILRPEIGAQRRDGGRS